MRMEEGRRGNGLIVRPGRRIDTDTGVLLLLVVNRLRAKGGLLVLAALPPGVRHVFELAGFLTLFAVEPDPERAVSRAAGGE